MLQIKARENRYFVVNRSVSGILREWNDLKFIYYGEADSRKVEAQFKLFMMRKVKFITFVLLVALGTTTTVFNAYSQSNTTDKGVVINGVKWATRNVDKPGTFAATPESAGMFYQWNRNTGWEGSTPSGTKFTDKATGNSIFLPAAGYRNRINGSLLNVGLNGFYWSSTARSTSEGYDLGLSEGNASWLSFNRLSGQSVRAVVE